MSVRLDDADRAWTNELLATLRLQLEERADGDALRLHNLRRRVVKLLGYDEKSKPSERKALKLRKMAEQAGCCTVCGLALPERGYYAVLDRQVAHLGYTDANVNLIHAACDYRLQEDKGFT